MEQPFSTSKVTVEYFDPHDVYKLLGPGLVPQLPLRNLHWQSHSGPLRSIDVLYVELLNAGAKASPPPAQGNVTGSDGAGAGAREDGFQTQPVGEGKLASTNGIDASSASLPPKERRHQIPGLRQTPYLKILLVRCDDSETYKATTRAEIREWVKEHTPPSQSTRKVNTQENHDAFEWLIVHVVVPNTVASTQPRVSGKSAEGSASDKSVPSSSRWRTGSSTLLEKMRADFAVTGKNSVDRVAQIRIGINDVPYDILPRVVPATPTGYSETEKDAENAWNELLMKFKSLILSSFDMRVTQYEDDIREKDAQRRLPGWNFCTFFILKEGLARGFESVGLVEDALVGYDELGVGLDAVIQDQIESGEPERNGGALLSYTEDLRKLVERALGQAEDEVDGVDEEEPVDLQSQGSLARDDYDEIPISSIKKPYRDMIVANNVSVFDFRCYIFSRQIALLLRLGNASSSKEELLEKLREQQEAVTHASSRQTGKAKKGEDGEDLSMLADVCQRTLQFIPAISHIMRKDITSALSSSNEKTGREHSNSSSPGIIDNLVATFAFSVAQQVLAQTATDSLPIPPSSLDLSPAQERKMSIPEPKTTAHPARSSSLHVRPTEKPLHSPGVFPGPGANRRASVSEGNVSAPRPFVKTGLGLLAAKRAELYALTRSVLEECGKKRGWSNGWTSVPDNKERDVADMEEINLDDESPPPPSESKPALQISPDATVSGLQSRLLRAPLSNKDDFYRLYETLTDKALRHYLVAEYNHAVQACLADLAVLKYYLADYAAAASYFHRTTPFFAEWRLLELSMLIMYAHCLQELRRKDEYVRVALKLLTKAAAAQKDRLSRKRSLGFGIKQTVEEPKMAAIEGLVGQLLDVVTALPNEVPVALAEIVTDVEIAGSPQYDEDQDGFTMGLNLRSLLVDDLTIERGRMCLSAASAGPAKEIWLECARPQVIKPGRNTVLMHSKTLVGGQYHVERLRLMSNKLHFYYERDIDQSQASTANSFRLPPVKIFRPSGGLDCRLSVARDIQLDQNNRLDLKLSTGWNAIDHCDIRIRPGTGGLRLLTTYAQFVDCNVEYAQPPEAGLFRFSSLAQGTTVQLRFPFSTEQDVASITVRIEVAYSTKNGDFCFSTAPSIPVSLALGVNVQDVFKHDAIFSRFSVSTASPSPIVLFKSELHNSDVFESEIGFTSGDAHVVFPKQPAGLLYKIKRRRDIAVGTETHKTMYLKLRYTVVLDEIMSAVGASLEQAATDSNLGRFTNMLTSFVREEISTRLSGYDLERASLLGEVSTALLVGSQLDHAFVGLGKHPNNGLDISQSLVDLIKSWQKDHPALNLDFSGDAEERPSILIPVDVPSVSIVFTADIQIHTPLASQTLSTGSGGSVTGVNQLLSASLTLKWTRAWDTATPQADGPHVQEFNYDVNAPSDNWLLGGRKRGQIVVSSSESSMEIPLMMIPLREGYLPYPTIDIREARVDDERQSYAPGHWETDLRNLGETVRVVANREKVTLSLDSSGPGGGPLVLESETRRLEGPAAV